MDGFGNKLQTGVGNVAQLSAYLHHHVDAWTSQFPNRYQMQAADTSLTITFGLYAEHPKRLGNGSTTRSNELTSPEGIAHLAGIVAIMSGTILGDGLLCQTFAIFPGQRVRGVVGIDAEHVSSSRQHIVIKDGVATRGRCNRSAVERTYHIVHLCLCGSEKLLA